MRIIVSLTTYPPRIGTINQVVESLMRQTRRPDEIVLWLSRMDFPEGFELPKNLDYAISRGLKIEYVDDNLKPHKKYFYALPKYPEDIVLTVDDDAIYPANLIEELYAFHLKFPDCVIATRVRAIKVTDDGNLCPYSEWLNESEIIGRPCYGLLPIGLGGVLYPPHAFHKEVLNKQAIVDLCMNADDIWLKFMQLLNGVRVVATRPIMMMPEYVKDSQKTSLWSVNKTCTGNDPQIKAITDYCNQLAGEKYIEKLLLAHRDEGRVVAESLDRDIPVRNAKTPRISVILPAFNVADYIEECITSLLKQRESDIEIICVDDGSTDGTAEKLRALAEKDDRIGVVWMTNHGAGVARNAGLERARGEYVFFCDPDDFCDVLLLDKLYYRAKASDCDVVLCGRRLYDDKRKQFTGVQLFAALPEAVESCEIKERIFNLFGYVPWNKIVRRSMLVEYDIKFQDLPRNNDIYFSNAVLVAAKRIGIVNEPLYAYRTNRVGSLQTAIDATPDTNIQAFRATYEFMKKLGKQEIYGESFKRMVWVEAIVRLAAFKLRVSAEGYYSKLCGEWVEEFGLRQGFDTVLSAAYLPAARATVARSGYDAYVKADQPRRVSKLPVNKDAVIADLRAKVAERDKWLETEKKKVADRDKWLEVEKKKVADREKWLETEKKKVADRDTWLEAEKKKVADCDKLLADAKSAAQVACNRNRGLEKKIKWYAGEVNALKASEAYRIGMVVTWPVRKVYRLIMAATGRASR